MNSREKLTKDHPFAKTILKNISKSIQLSPDEENYFLSLLHLKKFSKKEAVLEVGEVCRDQNFVLEGCLKIHYLDEDGQEHIVKFAIENWWAFDIESFFQSTAAYYGISCLENTTVLQLGQQEHEELLRNIPVFERFYRLMLQNSFIALQHRMTQSLSLSSDERYIRFQQKYPGLESRISQKSIASYLGITPVFLSVLRKEYYTKTLK